MKMPCKHITDTNKMVFKMGGLLCPKCRTIIHYAGSLEYTAELKRRRALTES